jgi:hypothetical protein
MAVFQIGSNQLIGEMAAELQLDQAPVRRALVAVICKAGYRAAAEVLIADPGEFELGPGERTPERPPPSWQEQRGRAVAWRRAS